jgi:hypothetical protein
VTCVRRAAFRTALEERLSVKVPSEDPDYEDVSEAWPAWQKPDRVAPKAELWPSERVLEAAVDMEAAR